MKKYLLSAAVLVLLASTGAQAATVYVLSNASYVNSFASNPIGCTGCGTGTATDDGFGNITLSGVNWSFTGGGNTYTAGFTGTTTLATGTTLLNTGGFCNQTVGTSVCTPGLVRSGFGEATYYTGIASDNVTTCTNNRCRVDLSLAGPTLTMVVKRGLSESATSTAFQQMTFTFTQQAAVPVPAAVWLFGSALGLMGLARRRTAA